MRTILQGLWSSIAETISQRPRANYDSVITGIPRSGTTLCCYLLSQLPNVIALNEPMRTRRIKRENDPVATTKHFLESTRSTLLTEGYAMVRATEKGITDNNFKSDSGQERTTVVSKRKTYFEKELSENFHLIIKHNALITMRLDDFRAAFPLYAIIRNPLAVLSSWNSLNLPVTKGRLTAVEQFAPQLDQELKGINDIYDKQLHILNWYFEQYHRLKKTQVIRYEQIIESNGNVLAVIEPTAAKLETNLNSKNRNKLYDREQMKMLADRLLNYDGAIWDFYTHNDVESLLQKSINS